VWNPLVISFCSLSSFCARFVDQLDELFVAEARQVVLLPERPSPHNPRSFSLPHRQLAVRFLHLDFVAGREAEVAKHLGRDGDLVTLVDARDVAAFADHGQIIARSRYFTAGGSCFERST